MSYNRKVLGERIRQERELLELSREKLAEHIGISVTYIGMIERGARNLSLENFVKTCQVFNKPMDSFFECRDKGKSVKNYEGVEPKFIKGEALDIVDILNTMSDKDINFIEEVVKTYKRHLLE